MKIRYKLLLTLVALSLLIITPIALLTIRLSQAIIIKTTFELCKNLSNNISYMSREELFLNTTYDASRSVIKRLKESNLRGLENVKLMNIEGVFVVSMYSDLQEQEAKSTLIDQIKAIDKLDYIDITENGKKYLRFISPVYLDDHKDTYRIGAAIFDFDKSLLFEPIEQIQFQILILCGIALVFSIIVAIVQAYFFTKAISTLSKGINIIGQGNLEHQIIVHSKDEIGEFAHSFNQLTRNILEANKFKDQLLNDIQELNSSLEQKVIERTAQLEKAKEIADMERKKSDDLLLNILPQNVALELREKGMVKPVYYENASILFTDFKGFTKIAEKLTPHELLDELDACFTQFDKIMERHNLEKLKTIGDSYMCAGGIPESNKTHAIDCCLAAIEIQTIMDQIKEVKKSMGLEFWELRLGIHTGPIIAGVVGEKKFAYDVWGDTVNLASRMESSGTPGRINISYSTYQAVKDIFECEFRGEIDAKNKGKVKMYYLNHLKAEFSKDENGYTPNKKVFQKLIT